MVTKSAFSVKATHIGDALDSKASVSKQVEDVRNALKETHLYVEANDLASDGKTGHYAKEMILDMTKPDKTTDVDEADVSAAIFLQ